MVGAGIAVLWFGYAVMFFGKGYLSGHPEGLVTVLWRHRSCGTAPKAKAKAKAKA